jgi:hypothetical protein
MVAGASATSMTPTALFAHHGAVRERDKAGHLASSRKRPCRNPLLDLGALGYRPKAEVWFDGPDQEREGELVSESFL